MKDTWASRMSRGLFVWALILTTIRLGWLDADWGTIVTFVIGAFVFLAIDFYLSVVRPHMKARSRRRVRTWEK
jgi:hypothetical protein